ncbi:Slp1 protein [Martiniozyma asiatica (nom. inval.)]|nr:Slp1 protein [Martiniozyma asiatica]
MGEEMEIELSMFIPEEQGKLYKDRFNFASFDCAATIVKTNNEAKGANAILNENKDSYLLNLCEAPNKYVIIELCEDILIDEVLIGNYEFYSSMFQHLRISASDRFPTTQWVVLGEFEAENVRTLQHFRVENPLIWAKFLKVEVLNHYGDEYYCPISSVQVHGTTMIEQFKQENDLSVDKQKMPGNEWDGKLPKEENKNSKVKDALDRLQSQLDSNLTAANVSMNADNETDKQQQVVDKSALTKLVPPKSEDIDQFNYSTMISFEKINYESDCVAKPYIAVNQFLIDNESRIRRSACLIDDEPTSSQTTHSTLPAKIQPQDSIYKNINRRLTFLESNATFSLLYQEEQAKLLTSAFLKFETQQLEKFQSLVNRLNDTHASHTELLKKLSTETQLKTKFLHETIQTFMENNEKMMHLEISKMRNENRWYKILITVNFFIIVLAAIWIILTRDTYIEEEYYPVVDEWRSPQRSKSPSLSEIIFWDSGETGSNELDNTATSSNAIDEQQQQQQQQQPQPQPQQQQQQPLPVLNRVPTHPTVRVKKSRESWSEDEAMNIQPTSTYPEFATPQKYKQVIYRRRSVLDKFKDWYSPTANANVSGGGGSGIAKQHSASSLPLYGSTVRNLGVGLKSVQHENETDVEHAYTDDTENGKKRNGTLRSHVQVNVDTDNGEECEYEFEIEVDSDGDGDGGGGGIGVYNNEQTHGGVELPSKNKGSVPSLKRGKKGKKKKRGDGR